MVSLGGYSDQSPHTPTATLSVVVKTQSAKMCLNLNFQGGGVFCSSQVPRSGQIFISGVGGEGGGAFCTKSQNRVFLPTWSKISESLA